MLHDLHLLKVLNAEISLLPTVTNPTDVAHVPSLELVARRIRTNSIDAPDHTSDDGQRVLTELFFSGNKKALVIDVA